MKILLTANTTRKIGGDASYVLYLRDLLADNGFKVDIFEQNMTCFFLALQRFKKQLKNNYDVVHHNNISLMPKSILKKFGRYKNIYTAHDPNIAGLDCNLNKINTRYDSSELDAIIAPSRFMCRLVNKSNVHYIPNFVYSKCRLHDVKERGYLLYAGPKCSMKGYFDILNYCRTREKRLLVLDNADKQTLLSYMKNADALVYPSFYHENCPLTILEALSVGTRVFAKNIGGIKEILPKHSLFNNIEELDFLLENNKVPRLKKRFTAEYFLRKYIKLIS